MRKFISILIAVMMVLTLLPVGRVMAENEDVTDEKVTEEGGEKGNPDPESEKGEKTELDKDKKDEKDEAEKQPAPAVDDLADAKAKAKAKINAMSDLTEDQKREFCNQVDAVENKDAIAPIVTAAEQQNSKIAEDKAKKADLEKAKTSLQEKFNKAKEAMTTVKYTKASDDKKAAFNKALDDAKNALAKEGVNAEELTAAETALTTALNNLDGKEDQPKPDDVDTTKETLKAKIDAAKAVKDTDKYKNAAEDKKTDFDKALEAAEAEYKNDKATVKTLDAAGTLLDAKKDALDGKPSTPVVPSDSYSTRVPRAIRTTIAKANAMIADSRHYYASDSSIATLESALATLKSIANDFENGYYNKYWNGKFWNGYYGDGWYDYYENGYYYRNGVPYEYNEFKARFGYYPRYDMSDGYYGRRYWNGKHWNGYYGDGWYDYSIGNYYYRNGVPYTYTQFKREFGYYPEYAYGRRYWNEYDEDWDPYYGYQGRYGYYNSTIRNAVERTVDAINDVAKESKAFDMTASYPSLSDYDGYYDYYPWYYDPYYYDGYYYDQSSSKVRELKKLIGEAEELAASRTDAQWAPYRSELTDAANYGRKAAKGRASVKGAIEELEKAIKKAKTDGMKLYIRRGFMTGVNGMEFNPNGTLTRAEMAQIIENLLEQSGETVAFAPKKFNDVEAGRWFKKAVNLISSHNIMKGNPDGNFYPQKPVSIEELIVIAARLGGHTPQTGNVFGISKHYWSVPYIQTAYVKGWIGMDKFDPSAAITRGQAVQILNRSLNYGVDKEFINKYGAQMNQFSDVTMSNPYYYDIIAATNTISYSQVPNSRTRIWRAFQTSGGWSTSKYSNGTYVKPYTGW